jgi:DNA-binding NarL/FixJ family response regulator
LNRTNVVIADDHPMVRQALGEALSGVLGGGLRVTEAGSLSAARVALQTCDIDLMLLDLNMPGMEGALGLAALRADFPAVPILVVSAIDDSATIRQVVELGASGFLPKSAPLSAIGEAVRAVLAGDLWLPISAEDRPAAPDEEIASRAAELTPQQRRVLDLLSEGKFNKQIAFELKVTEATIKAHLSQIFRKLGVRSRTQAVIVARRLNAAVTPRPAR